MLVIPPVIVRAPARAVVDLLDDFVALTPAQRETVQASLDRLYAIISMPTPVLGRLDGASSCHDLLGGAPQLRPPIPLN